MAGHIYLGLLHFPVYNKNKECITTSIANLDIHDIARCVMTYNIAKYYLIHPLPTQKQLVQEIIDYWQKGFGAEYNPDRRAALSKVAVRDSLAMVKAEIAAEDGVRPKVIVTDAQAFSHSIGYPQMREIIAGNSKENYLLLFGTGWGIAREIMEEADYLLAPIFGTGTYNHLSVRSAAAIILDRLCGEKWWV